MSDTVPVVDTTGDDTGLPQDRTVDRRWFVSRSAALAAGGSVALAAAASVRPAAAAPAAVGNHPFAFAGHVRPEALGDLTELTIAEAAGLIRSRRISPADLTEAYLDRLDRFEPVYLAFNHLRDRDDVMAQARALGPSRRDKHWKPKHPLHGVSLAPKDNYYTRDMPTTANSPVYTGFVPDYDATCIARLRAKNGIILGKAQMGALASGRGVIPGTNIPTTRNAWTPDDIRYSPSGSSGGTATAVAARLATGGIGTQTGGSITSPSTAQNLTGMAPTFGRTSLFGVIPLTYTVDRTGPLARDVKDCAIILQVLAGADENDPRTKGLPPVPDYITAATPVVKRGRVVPRFRTTIGVPPDFLTGSDPQVVALRRSALDELADVGYRVVDVTMPDEWDLLVGDLAETQHASGAHYFMPWLQQDVRLFGPRLDGFLPFVLRSGPGLLKLQQANVILLKRILEQLFAQCDVTFVNAGNFNRPGLPTISMPIGFGTDPTTGVTVPRGVVLGGAPFGEERLLSVVAAFQAVTDFHLERPPDPTVSAAGAAGVAARSAAAAGAGPAELRERILAENARYPVPAGFDPEEA